jgi:AhpD family alkylhydroperoxidase
MLFIRLNINTIPLKATRYSLNLLLLEDKLDSEPKKFKDRREQLNKLVMEYSGLEIKRFFNLDNEVYRAGALDVRTKELLGLVASLVLRCDDCVKYHLSRCDDERLSDNEVVEALGIGLVVGGSITIPHLRKAIEFWDELKREREK